MCLMMKCNIILIKWVYEYTKKSQTLCVIWAMQLVLANRISHNKQKLVN